LRCFAAPSGRVSPSALAEVRGPPPACRPTCGASHIIEAVASGKSPHGPKTSGATTGWQRALRARGHGAAA